VTLERDYEHLRRDAGARRGTRDVVAVQGPDAASYLQGQCSQDLAGLEPGAAADTFVLSPEGRVEVLARVVRLDEDTFHLDTDVGFAEVLVARLRRFVLRSKLTIERTEWSCVSICGPSARAWPGLSAPVVVPVAWPGWDGVDLLGAPADLVVPEDLASCGEAAWEAARIEAGVPAMGREVGNGEIPAETGLVGRTVSFTKGCFTGQELVARMDARAGAPPHRLAGLVLEVDVDPSELLGAGLAPKGATRALGRVTSAASCPGLGAVGALAYLHRSVPVPGRVQVVSRDHPHHPGPLAEVRPLPMV
jgi:folate-binding protein YgfZ